MFSGSGPELPMQVVQPYPTKLNPNSSKYLLNSDEREIGSLIIDIGSSTTSYCLSKKGNPILTGALPVGGSQFTSDLSIAFSTNIDFANQLKLETSCTPENERIAEKVIVRDKDSSKTFEITKRQISQVLKERAVEIFTLIKQDIIEKMGVENLPERLILCGGGSKIQGIVALGRNIFQSKARLAENKNLKFLGENLPLESMAVISSANLIHELDFQNEYIHKSNKDSNNSSKYSIETKAGLKIAQYNNGEITVKMGKPVLDANQIPTTINTKQNNLPTYLFQESNFEQQGYAVGMGNPHLIFFIKDINKISLSLLGPIFENNKLFPEKTNVHFSQIIDRNNIKVRVWERGAGPTLACGTGACAVHVAAFKLGLCNSETTINLPGGNLKIKWSRLDDEILMTGYAKKVFSGKYFLK